MKFKKEDIIQHGRNLGIIPGDFLFITADLLSVRYFSKDRVTTESDWFDILKNWVGEHGDVILASYTNSFLKFRKNDSIVFTRTSETTSGSLSSILINRKECFRSTHPTNSYVGFGSRAKKVLLRHSEHSSSYSVVDDILKYNAKNIMLGTIDKKNAPMSFHQVLHKMGYNYKHPFCGLGQSFYYNQLGELKLFTRRDVGGCSSGSFKMLPELINLSKSRIGNIGFAKTLVLDGNQANDRILSLLMNDISYAKCLDRSCISCYGRFRDLFGFIPYLLNFRKIFDKLIN